MTIGFFGLLTLLLAAAKLFGFASFSWLVVFTPVIIGTGLGLFFFAGALVMAVLLGKK